MPYAQVLTTASIASAAGGTFADSLTAQGTDSLAVANFNNGGARMLEMWAIDGTNLAEGQLIYTRPEATHDQQHGMRFNIQSAAFNAAGKVGEVAVLRGLDVINVFKSDVAVIQVSATATDAVVASFVIEYDDLPGASAVFIDQNRLQGMHKSRVGIACNAQASGTKGAYGTARAINADDDRLHANTWYAILGVSVQTDVTTVSFIGPDWGGQRIGLPAGAIEISSATYFLDQTIKWGKPLLPCFNSNNKGNVLLQVADAAASTNPKIDVQLVELTGYPG